jgi:peptide/nickel transport system permease protein
MDEESARVISRVPRIPKMLSPGIGGIIGLLIVVGVLLVALVGPAFVLDPQAQDINNRLLAPGQSSGAGFHLLGTDALGRDLLAQLVWGARVSLLVGVMAVLLSGIIGVTLGLVVGYFGGAIDHLIMRVVDIFMAMPFLILVLALAAVLGAGVRNIIVTLVLLGWVSYTRIVRAEVLALRQQEFVDAARCIGVPDRRIMVRHILPNVLSSVIVLATLELGRMILSEASISYLGFGVQPPTPAWGVMTADGQQYIYSAWWLPVLPGIAILVTVLGANMLGDWLRDRSDPRLLHSGRGDT